MRSKTKLAIDPETIKKLFDKAGIPGAEHIAPLGAGEYNSVYAANASGKAYAIKIAPHPSATILTYEQDMMAQEIYYYKLMANQARISVPQIFYVDFSKEEIPAEYFIMQRLSGTQIDQANLDDSQKKEAEQKLAAMAAQMHSVKGEKFGYRQNQLFDNWYLALESMVTNLIADCRRLHHGTRRGQKLLTYIHEHRAVLEKVESVLINFDIWPPNIFCDNQNDDIKLSWIDPERCLWGDRIADFVCLDFMNMSLNEKDATIQAYNQVSAEPVTVGTEEKIRFAIMLGYLGLIIEVEKYARYTLLHYGYWRNIMAANMLLSNCFTQLEALTSKD
jgi:aminoglycoside phosphotransferase (APT) family kinase protein